MSLKILTYIRNKAQLQSLYMSQYPVDFIRKEINAIIKATRKNSTPGSKLFAKNISTLEATIFIYWWGTPDGYLLSEELKIKLQEYREKIINQIKL